MTQFSKLSRTLTKLVAAVSTVAVTWLAIEGAAFAETALSARAKAMRAPSETSLQEILKTAKPMDKMLSRKPALLSAANLKMNFAAGAPPVVTQGSVGEANRSSAELKTPGNTKMPRNFGSGNLATVFHYTDSLVNTALRRTFPTRSTGFLLFKQHGNWYYCSGSMISRSLVLVAGHCVHSGNNSSTGWNSEAYFYPSASGLNGGTPVTPYGVASASTFWTWTSWYQTGALDQGYDVGIVVLNTRDNNANPTFEMGAFTGWYGVCLSNCLQPYWSLTQLGYPGNYYGGNFMTKGEHLYVSDGRDYVYGSGMRGGSSGGPHIANMGALSDSAADQGQWPFRNIVFAATSWGYNSESPKIQGASALSGPNNSYLFKNLFNPACGSARAVHGTGSCSFF